MLLVVKTINLGLVDLVEGVDGIGDGSFLVVSKSSLKSREKIRSGFCPVRQDMSGKFGCPVEPYLKSMVLDLGSLDAVGVLRSNSTIGISYKS